jgi:hypothetical protein
MIRSIGVETAFLQSEALVTEFVDLYGRESVILKAGISPDEMQ